MTFHNGALGMVNGVTTIRNWGASITAALNGYAASNTKGATGHNAGNKDWSGSWACYGPEPAQMPGDTFAFTGSVDGTKGITGNAIIDSVTINWDIAGAKEIDHTVNFSGNGAAAVGAAVVANDTSDPEIYSCFNLEAVKLGDDTETGGEFTALANVKTVALTLTAANVSTVNSSTAGWTGRAKGNITATLAITVDVDDLSDLPTANSVKAVRLYVNGTQYWEILWFRFSGFSNVVVDRETNQVVGATINANLVTGQTISESFVNGKITKPGAASPWWPAA